MYLCGKVCPAGILALIIAACGGGTDSHDPANLLKLGGDGQTALIGVAVPESLVVRVVDDKGDGVSGVAIAWAVVAGGGTVAPAASVSDATGRLAARWTLGSVGANAVAVTAAGFTVTFAATATTTPPPTNVLALISEPPTGQSGVTFSPQPAVQIQDGQGVPVTLAGVSITAAIASGSTFATLNGTRTLTTGANGRVIFTNLSITGPVGNYTLSFSAAGFTVVNSSSLSLSSVSGRVPLTDMGSRTYLGFSGGLYANGGNSMPGAHATAGAARARNIVPRALNGTPNAGGKIVLMTVGMSHNTQEWCNDISFPCNSWSFTGQAAADGAVDHTTLVIANGAKGGQTAVDWVSAASPNYDRVRDSVLTPQGLSEEQVQVIWLKLANPDPTVSLPSNSADAITLLGQMGDVLRVLDNRYPNLQMVFVSSRSFGGYAVTTLNPEPYAYESGLAVKWLIQAQIDQMANGGTIVDNRAGDLNFNTSAPWIAWGPYLWADGLNPRSDGLTWSVSEMEPDGTHPSTPGESKVGAQLLLFFKIDVHAACWFLAAGSCP